MLEEWLASICNKYLARHHSSGWALPPREITGQRTKGADQAAADAVKAANALMLGAPYNLAPSVLSAIHVTKA